VNQYEPLAYLLALWLFLAIIAAFADALAGAHKARTAHHRARHARQTARHAAARPDPYRNDYLIRRPSRFPAAAKGWDRR